MTKFGNSLVSNAHKYVLWWHAKAGCTSLKTWYLEQFGYEVALVDGQWNAGGLRVHERIHEWKNKFVPDQHTDYFHFTVLRHPLARFWSHYSQQMSAKDEVRDLHQYIRYVITDNPEVADPHIAQQAYRLYGNKMHAILRLEEINEHWEDLMEMLELPRKPLPVLNSRGEGSEWETNLTNKTLLRLLKRHYAQDFELYEKCAL